MRYLNLDSYKENQVILLNYKALDEFQIFNCELQLIFFEVKKKKKGTTKFFFGLHIKILKIYMCFSSSCYNLTLFLEYGKFYLMKY